MTINSIQRELPIHSLHTHNSKNSIVFNPWATQTLFPLCAGLLIFNVFHFLTSPALIFNFNICVDSTILLGRSRWTAASKYAFYSVFSLNVISTTAHNRIPLIFFYSTFISLKILAVIATLFSLSLYSLYCS